VHVLYTHIVDRELSSTGSGSLGHGANAHSHSQRPMPRGFPFKRCEWLVGNWTVSIWTSLSSTNRHLSKMISIKFRLT